MLCSLMITTDIYRVCFPPHITETKALSFNKTQILHTISKPIHCGSPEDQKVNTPVAPAQPYPKSLMYSHLQRDFTVGKKLVFHKDGLEQRSGGC